MVGTAAAIIAVAKLKMPVNFPKAEISLLVTRCEKNQIILANKLESVLHLLL